MGSFRMYRTPGPPGRYFGYIEVDGVSYRITAQSVPDERPLAPTRQKMYVGTVERNLKADQQALPLGKAGSNPAAVCSEQRDAAGGGTRGLTVPRSEQPTQSHGEDDFDDPIPTL